ncbi:MAG: hypothetical protein EOO53_14285 [Gammaproteobacteria bacterium]|nr:MAG: hypothetical protein EOO53_14285 [Gammaproteobacteria bacterium]
MTEKVDLEKNASIDDRIETVEKALLQNVINLAGGDLSNTCGTPASDDGTCYSDTCYSCVTDDGGDDDYWCFGS